MKEVYFKNLLIADLQNHTARDQSFEKGLNVITSTDNHVGKSSLLKSLYYTLGAEVNFDPVWDKQSKLYVSTLAVDEKEYRIVRFMKRFAVFKGEKLLKITDSVSKELAPLLGEIFDFSVYLPNKNTDKVEMAPPAFSFMPYYIDQDNGWSGLYDSFAAINQYNRADRIKSLYYHLNIYTRGTVELMAKRDRLKDQLEVLEMESERLNTILTALREETVNLPPADTVSELSDYGKMLLPVMAGAHAAQGGVTASAALYAGTMIFDALLGKIISQLMVPMVYMYLSLSVAGCALGEDLLKRLRDLIKWLITWCLKNGLYIFTGYLSVTGVVSGATDAAKLRQRN